MLRKPLQSITGIAIAQDKINVMEQLGRNFRVSILSIEEDKQRLSCLCKKEQKVLTQHEDHVTFIGRKCREGAGRAGGMEEGEFGGNDHLVPPLIPSLLPVPLTKPSLLVSSPQ